MFRVPKEAVDTLLSLVFFISTADAIDGARWPSTLSFSSLYAVRGPADSLVAFESVRAAAALGVSYIVNVERLVVEIFLLAIIKYSFVEKSANAE